MHALCDFLAAHDLSFFSLKHTPITSVGERAAARVERSSGAEPIIWLLGSVLIIQMPI